MPSGALGPRLENFILRRKALDQRDKGALGTLTDPQLHPAYGLAQLGAMYPPPVNPYIHGPYNVEGAYSRGTFLQLPGERSDTDKLEGWGEMGALMNDAIVHNRGASPDIIQHELSHRGMEMLRRYKDQPADWPPQGNEYLARLGDIAFGDDEARENAYKYLRRKGLPTPSKEDARMELAPYTRQANELRRLMGER